MINSLIVGFAMGWVGSMPLAGVVSMFVFRRGLAGRFRRGLVLAAGAAATEAVWCLIAIIGAEQVLSRWPTLGVIAKSVGGFILLGLGVYTLRSPNILPTSDNGPDQDLNSSGTFLREFRLGMVLVAGNISIPFNWLGMITVVVSLGLDPMAGPPWMFAMGVAVGIMSWFTLLLKILAAFRARYSQRTHKRLMKSMGFLLLAVGLFALLRAWL